VTVCNRPGAASSRRESARRAPRTDPSRRGREWLDPEIIGAYLGPLLRSALTLCDSRESAEDLVQETVARVLSRPRLLRGGDERAYLMQALRNTFLTSRRTAARRPRLVATLEKLDPADRCTRARPEEAVIAGQVFPAIAQLPQSFRLALVAVDIAGLSYGEAAQVLGAPEATITSRLYRARQRVARELDPERSAIRNRSAPARE
jgi:RNA polymerase sigma-70 factor, ECF subfamily